MARLHHDKMITDGMKSTESVALAESSPPTIVTVGQGDATLTWHLPRALLCYHSSFFDRALKETFQKSLTSVVTLPSDSTETFSRFVQWLYLGRCSLTSTRSGDNEVPVDLVAAADAWVLGDKLGCHSFQDYALLHLIEDGKRHSITAEVVAIAYCHTAWGSKLRKYVMALFINGQFHASSSSQECHLCWQEIARIDEFAQDLVKIMLTEADKRPKDPQLHIEPYLRENNLQKREVYLRQWDLTANMIGEEVDSLLDAQAGRQQLKSHD